MSDIPTDESIYAAVHREIHACWLVSHADKHDADTLLKTLNLPSLKNRLLAKLDRRNKVKDNRGGPSGIIFPLDVCQRIMNDVDNTDAYSLRDSIARAIVRHRVDALGVDETMTVDADHSYDDDDDMTGSNGSASSGGRSQHRRGGHANRSRSRSPPQRPPPHGDEAAPTIAAATKAAIEALMPPARLQTYTAAMSVLTEGVGDKSIADKRQLWTALCPLGPLGKSIPRRKMIDAACGVLMGDAHGPEVALPHDMAVLTSMVERVLSGDLDKDRVCLALRIIRRHTLLPKAGLKTILECSEADVGKKMLNAAQQLHSWTMRYKPDGSNRPAPLPWVAEVCRVAFCILDVFKQQH